MVTFYCRTPYRYQQKMERTIPLRAHGSQHVQTPDDALISVTYRSLRVWSGVWRQLLRCCMRLCASVVTWAPPSSHVYRVPWAVTVFWCGLATAGVLCFVMLCIRILMCHDIMGHGQSGESETRFTTGVGLPTVNLPPPLQS